MHHFDPFKSLMSGSLAPREIGEIGAALAHDVKKACDALGLGEAEIHCGGGWVTLLLTPNDAWEVIVVGPDAYQFYPGFINEQSGVISWPNIWVADNYPLVRLLAELEEALAAAARVAH